MSGEVGLLLDYGGVLTTPVGDSFFAWEREHGFARGEVVSLIQRAYDDADGGIIGRYERGELTTPQFESELTRLFAQQGRTVPDGSLVDAMFARMQPAGPLWSVAAQAREAGVRVGLLSNSWGTSMYPRARLDASFDAQVISCEVGLRKPDPEIYELAADRLGLPATRCAFVDDLGRNVEVAERLGMHGVVHHGDAAATVRRLEPFLGIELTLPDGVAAVDGPDPAGD
jgi:epoxide hydrolase-like predicted phosphatase